VNAIEPEDAADRAARHLRLLAELQDLGMALARATVDHALFQRNRRNGTRVAKAARLKVQLEHTVGQAGQCGPDKAQSKGFRDETWLDRWSVRRCLVGHHAGEHDRVGANSANHRRNRSRTQRLAVAGESLWPERF